MKKEHVENLKPCVFCGGSAGIENYSLFERRNYYIVCHQCFVEVYPPDGHLETYEKTFEFWNNRYIPDNIDDLAKNQNVEPMDDVEKLYGTWPDELSE